jgi:beta-fructofuranosidase
VKSMSWTRRSFVSLCSAAGAISFLEKSCLAEALSPHTLAGDPLRPQFHLLPAKNWMNDPNGPIYWGGKYHMFYQYNPEAAKWGDMHWAHAISPDMIHWRHLPVALSPTPDGPDRDGCFSGSTVIHQGLPTILYTGVRSTDPSEATLRDGTHNFHESQCIATSHDPELRSWITSSSPVIADPPHDLAVTGFRDPCVWKDGQWWYMALGSGIRRVGGCVLLYRSPDLRSWEYLHPLITGQWNGTTQIDPVDSGEMWECPDFFELDGKHVLLYSTERKVYWSVGDLDRKQMIFHPQKTGLLDSGAFYAPKTMLDNSGRRVLWGWIPETRPESEFVKSGWAGSMGLPRILSLGLQNVLQIEPLPELRSLRRANHQSQSFTGFKGEIVATVSQPRDGDAIIVGPAHAPYITVQYAMSNSPEVSIDGSTAILKVMPGALSIHLFMDASVIEVFINKTLAHTKRSYNLDLSVPRTHVRTKGKIDSLQVWEIKSISDNRLTT